MRFKINVQPADSGFSAQQNCFPYQFGTDTMPLEIWTHHCVKQKGVLVAVPSDVHESDQQVAIESTYVTKTPLQNRLEVAVARSAPTRRRQLVELPIVERRTTLVSHHFSLR